MGKVKSMYSYILLINLLTFVLMGLDKHYACHRKSRISEVVLLLCGFMGGGIAGLIAMTVFKHKIRKLAFYLVYWTNTLLVMLYLTGKLT